MYKIYTELFLYWIALYADGGGNKFSSVSQAMHAHSENKSKAISYSQGVILHFEVPSE